MTKEEILDLLDRAFQSGCFPEVIKLIRQGSEKKLIEVIIKKAEQRNILDPFNFDDLFGGD